jgi:D-amino-acid oxidase
VTQTPTDVLVVGAGVIGLTTAVWLAEAGVAVAVAAAEPPEQSTSFTAGAIWGPHLVGKDDRVARWADVAVDRLTEFATAGSAASELTGVVRIASGIAANRAAGAGPPEVASASSGLTACPPGEVPDGYQSAWRLSAPVVAMPQYLDYLRARYIRAGGELTFPAKFASLHEAAQHVAGARVIVNCTGCGARDLVPDPDVTPVRGQVVVASNPGITEFFVGTGDDDDLTYLFPHGDIVLLGGTEQLGNWSRDPDPATADRIVAACTAVQPSLRDARVLGHRVGLRPFRPSVRLEAEASGGVTIVHNYGHGGAGVTLSWGCAQDAAALVIAALS